VLRSFVRLPLSHPLAHLTFRCTLYRTTTLQYCTRLARRTSIAYPVEGRKLFLPSVAEPNPHIDSGRCPVILAKLPSCCFPHGNLREVPCCICTECKCGIHGHFCLFQKFVHRVFTRVIAIHAIFRSMHRVHCFRA